MTSRSYSVPLFCESHYSHYSVKVIIPCLSFPHPGMAKFRRKAVRTVTLLGTCSTGQQFSERIKCHEIMHVFFQSFPFQNVIYLCLVITLYSKCNTIFSQMQENPIYQGKIYLSKSKTTPQKLNMC